MFVCFHLAHKMSTRGWCWNNFDWVLSLQTIVVIGSIALANISSCYEHFQAWISMLLLFTNLCWRCVDLDLCIRELRYFALELINLHNILLLVWWMPMWLTDYHLSVHSINPFLTSPVDLSVCSLKVQTFCHHAVTRFSILPWKYICMLTIIKSTFVSFYNPSLSFYTAQLLIILHYPFLGVQQIKI